MANLMKRSTKPDLRCKKHPKHSQSPGVCSVCLREKLSQLSTPSSSTSASARTGLSSSSSSSASSYYSSSSGSSCSSPMHGYRFTTSSGRGKNSLSLSLLLFGGKNNVLTKSRSLAFVPRNTAGREVDDKKLKKVGFFSKLLLRSRTNKKIEGGLVHSTTMREIRVAT